MWSRSYQLWGALRSRELGLCAVSVGVVLVASGVLLFTAGKIDDASPGAPFIGSAASRGVHRGFVTSGSSCRRSDARLAAGSRATSPGA